MCFVPKKESDLVKHKSYFAINENYNCLHYFQANQKGHPCIYLRQS